MRPGTGFPGVAKKGPYAQIRSGNNNGNETKVRRQGSGYVVVAELGEVVRERRRKRERTRESAVWWGTPLLRRTAIVASLVEQLRLIFPPLMVIDYKE